MDHTLVIVESPTKAKTIRKFLPSNYEVLASMGHVRDLPKGAAEIPAAVKKEKWSRIGVNTTEDFEPLYIVPKDKKKVVKELKDALKGATQLLLATDKVSKDINTLTRSVDPHKSIAPKVADKTIAANSPIGLPLCSV